MTTSSPIHLSLRRVIIERINDRFSYGQYGEFRIILMNNNGYVNATKLCSGSKKHPNRRFRDWARCDMAKELVEEAESEISSAQICADETYSMQGLIKISGGKTKEEIETRGTYVHPLLVAHIASWYDSSFAMKVGKIVNTFSVREFEEKIRVKDDKIDELQRNMERLIKDNQELIKKSDQLLKDNVITHELLQDTKDQLDVTDENLERVQDQLGIAVVDRVPKQKYPSKNEQFILLKPLPKKEDARYDYYVIRGQKDYLKARLNTFLKDFPETQTLLCISYQPNSRNLYLRLKQKQKYKIMYGANWFSIRNWNEEDLVNSIKYLNNEKYDVDE